LVKKVWATRLHANWKVFIWKVINKAFSLAKERKKRNMEGPYGCKLCRTSEESVSHMLKDWKVAKRTLNRSPMGINVDTN